VIAAVNGPAAGAGLALVPGSDIRVAAMVLGDRRQATGLVSADHRAAVREFPSRAATGNLPGACLDAGGGRR
jgi:hypothetical protein